MTGPAYRILTPRLVLRCWEPTDAPRLQEAITRSLDELRRWMPWAQHEPEELEAKVLRLRKFRAEFDQDREHVYGIFSRTDPQQILGSAGLHRRAATEVRELGYWIHSDYGGRGHATEAAGALTRLAFEVDRVRRAEIRCEPDNVRSARVAAKLGFRHEATLRQDVIGPDRRPRDTMIWALLAEDYRRCPAQATPLEAFDALQRRLNLD